MTQNLDQNQDLIAVHNKTIKWTNPENDAQYCLRLIQDDQALDPRTYNDMDQLACMACFHPHHKLGDQINTDSPLQFWKTLVDELVDNDAILQSALNPTPGLHSVQQNSMDPSCYDLYEPRRNPTDPPVLVEEMIPADQICDALVEQAGISQCMTWCKPFVQWKPLWLYDHSGLSISCGPRTYPYNDQWDSSQLGWILVKKDDLLRHFPAENDDTWRQKADKVMEDDIETYEQYLQGNTWGYEMYFNKQADPDGKPDWDEIETVWGYYGDNILKNGIVGSAGCNLKQVLESNQYTIGRAVEKHITVLEL